MTTLSPDELSNITDSIADNNTASTSGDIMEFDQMQDGEIDLSEFMDDTPSQAENSNSASKIEDGDVDLSEFMDTESVDLDSFMDNSNFAEKPAEVEIQDEKPIDMELSFDDNYQQDEFVNTEENESIPSDFNADAIISDSNESEDFDTMFDNIVDESAVEEKPAADVSGFTSDSVSFEDVTDFDDLLSSLDDTPQQADTPQEEKPQTKENNDIDISVTMETDEADETNNKAETEKNSDEPVEDVPLFGTIDSSFNVNQNSETRTENDTFDNASVTSDEIEDLDSLIENAEEISEPAEIEQADEIISEDEIIPEIEDNKEELIISEENDTTLNLDELNAISANNDIIQTSDQTKDSNESNQENTMNEMSNSLLEKIYGEITSLKDELSSLKLELNTLKSSGIVSQTEPKENTKLESEKEENSGFFSDLGDDETIALSGDELNNILVNSDFTEENPENENTEETFEEQPEETVNDLETENIQDTDLGSTEEINDSADQYENDMFGDENSNIDFNSNLVEPSLDDLDFSLDSQSDEAETDADSQTELSVDDVFVDSTTEDIMDTETETISDSDIASFDEGIDEELNLDDENDIITTDEVTDADMLNGISAEVDNFEGLDQSLDEIDEFKTEKTEPEKPTNNLVEQNKTTIDDIDVSMKQEVKSVLAYMDQLLENLPEDKIAEFAKSEHFETYKKLFQELGIS
jgi:hypothetical protein